MRKIFYTFMLLMAAVPISTMAQISEGGTPCSMQLKQLKSTVVLPSLNLKSIDTDQMLSEDIEHPFPQRYAIFEDTIMDIKTIGKHDVIENASLWRLRIASTNAKSLQIIFKVFCVPPGAKLFIYKEDYSLIYGAFTQLNTQADSTFTIADFPGDNLIIEYFEPESPTFKGKVIIGSVSKGYRNLSAVKAYEYYINANCPQGKGLQEEKHAVAKMTFRSGRGSYNCTGALINNTRNDATPYFLTAHHCISTQAEASTLITYFNYENEGCEGSLMDYSTLSGANLLTTADSSDYTLLLLSSVPPLKAQPYYAGWNRSGNNLSKAYGIHHPEGLSKKISFDYDTVFSNPFPLNWQGGLPSPEFSHWIVVFDDGITAGGSSGSPLFDMQRRIIGQLHGGAEAYDFYGTLNYSWNNKPHGFPSIADYLDPDHTGLDFIDGYAPSTNPPDAFFVIKDYLVCLNAPLELQNFSVFQPSQFKWSFQPNTVNFLNSTSETSAQPVITFLNPGYYTLQLRATNGNGADSLRILNGILAGSTINVDVKAEPDDFVCVCDFNRILFTAQGASGYSWTLADEDSAEVELLSFSGDSVWVKPQAGFLPDSGYAFSIQTVGMQGTCIDTNTLNYLVRRPVNDEIIHAIPLTFGKSKTYSNICATIQQGEPIPPYTSCVSQLSWCDEYGNGEDIVENSVWFSFVAPASGKIRVYSTGMDNEIAVYEADSVQGILNGDYMLKGANDDRTETDPTPNLRSVTVKPGKIYWIQVDGSGGGTEDDFYMYLYEVIVNDLEETTKTRLVIFPQPVRDEVTIKDESFQSHKELLLEVFNNSGHMIYKNYAPVNQDGVRLNVAQWSQGMYFIKVYAGTSVYTGRIIKY